MAHSESLSNVAQQAWANARFMSKYITDKYMVERADVGAENLNALLQKMWSDAVDAAKIISSDDHAWQWALVACIAGAKARGPLVRSKQIDSSDSKIDVTTESYTVSGLVVWTDMPFFSATIQEAWTNGPPRVSAEAWRNLNCFAARLTATGAVDLMQYGIWTIRDALETPRALSRFDRGEGEGYHQNSTVEDLLPAVTFWFKYCASQIVDGIREKKYFASAEQETIDEKCEDVGHLALDAGVISSRFSLPRYRFWKSRLQDFIGASRSSSPVSTQLVDVALEAFRYLNSHRFAVGDEPYPK